MKPYQTPPATEEPQPGRIRQFARDLRDMIFEPRCTCVRCPDRTRCEWAFDEYNQDGECLMEK